MKTSLLGRHVILLFSLLLIGPAIGWSQPQVAQAKSASVGNPLSVSSSLTIRAQVMAPLELSQRQDNINEHHLPVPMTIVPGGILSAPLSIATATDVMSPPSAASFITNRGLTDAETNNITSQINEPSVGARGQEVLITGNWFSTFSKDGGNSFSYRNPSTTFPSANGGFCCDQVVLYDPGHDLMIWFLQYIQDGSANTMRIAVAKGNDITNEAWRYYDFTPQSVGGWSNQWFDYPDLAVTADFLYITTNTFTTPPYSFTRSVVLRLPLNDLANYTGFNYNYFDRTDVGSIRPTQGSAGTMYLGTHISNNTLRVFSWTEPNTSYNINDIGIQQWSDAQRTAPGPDGNDWLGRADGRITAAWESGNNIGFAWTAAQDPNFSFPQVRVAIMDKSTKAVVTQPHIWNPSFAYAYPAAAPNNAGEVGLSVSFGGGSTLFPSHAVGWYSSTTNSWDLTTTVNGTNGPSQRNAWGDYAAVRPHGSNPSTWVATGHTLQGGSTGNDVQTRYVHFGKDSGIQIQVTLDNLEPAKVLKQGDTVKLRATVTENGSPKAGETVTFSSSNTNVVTVAPSSKVTDSNGVAEVTATAQSSTSTSVTITANVSSANDDAIVQVPDMSLIGFVILLLLVAFFSLFIKPRQELINSPKSDI